MHLGGPTEQLLIKSVFAGATSYWENTAGRNHLHFLNLPNYMHSNASSACLTSWRPEHWIHLTYPEMELESSNAILQRWAINDLGVGACSFCDNRLLSKGQVLTWETVRLWKDRRIWSPHSFWAISGTLLKFFWLFLLTAVCIFLRHVLFQKERVAIYRKTWIKTNNETRKHEYRHNRTNKSCAQSAFKNEAKLMCTITIYTPSYEEPER